MTGIVPGISRLLCATALAMACSSCAMNEKVQKQAEYHYKLGVSYLADDNYTGALVELTAAEKLMPDDPELLNHLGRVYFAKKRYDLAESKYLKSLELKPNYSEARNNLGVNYLEQKRWDAAIVQFKKVTDDLFYTRQDIAVVNLGLAYFGKGDYPMALSTLRSAVISYPRDPRGRLYLGKVYFTIGKVELAIVEYKSALDLYRNFPDAQFNLGLAYLKLKEVAAAADAFREVLRLDPNSEIGHLSREYLESLK